MTYYVDQTRGDDANPGTKEKPFCTIGMAIIMAEPEDTIILAEGTYNVGDLVFPCNVRGEHPYQPPSPSRVNYLSR